MKIHAIHHFAHEGLGFIDTWIKENNLPLSETFTYQSPTYPSVDEFDGLIIMGGPMSVHDTEQYPWLIQEKELIKEAIEQEKKVLGICLGAQLVAESLGSNIYKNHTPEIGWFPVKKTFLFHSWFTGFDDKEQETVFHWHSDTFDMPEGAVRLFMTDACKNQAFQYEDNVLALQFHLEMDQRMISGLLDIFGNELVPKQYVQNNEKILKTAAACEPKAQEMLFDLLSCFFLEGD